MLKRYLSIVGLVALVVLAISAVGAATASAGVPEVVLKAGKVFPILFNSTSHEKVLRLEGAAEAEAIRCKKDKNSGEIINAKEDHVTITFEECSTAGGLVQCHSAGQNAGIIKTKLLKSLLAYVFPRVGKETGLVLSPVTGTFIEGELVNGKIEKEEIICGTVKVVVRGSIIGAITPLNVFAGNFNLAVELNAAKEQKIKEYEAEGSGKGTRDTLECSKNGAAFKGCTEQEVMSDEIEILPAGETIEIKA